MTNFFIQSAWALAGSPCLILVLNWDSSVLSLSDWGISSQVLETKEERLSVPYKNYPISLSK